MAGLVLDLGSGPESGSAQLQPPAQHGVHTAPAPGPASLTGELQARLQLLPPGQYVVQRHFVPQGGSLQNAATVQTLIIDHVGALSSKPLPESASSGSINMLSVQNEAGPSGTACEGRLPGASAWERLAGAAGVAGQPGGQLRERQLLELEREVQQLEQQNEMDRQLQLRGGPVGGAGQSGGGAGQQQEKKKPYTFLNKIFHKFK